MSLSIPWGMGRVIDAVARGGGDALPVGKLILGGTAVFAVAGVAAFARTALMRVRWRTACRRRETRRGRDGEGEKESEDGPGV